MLENYQLNILKILSIEFGVQSTPHPRCFLLPDGNFLTSPVDEWNKNAIGQKAYRPHFALDNFLGNCIFDYCNKSYEKYRYDTEEDKKKKREKYHLEDKDFFEIYDKVDWDEVGNNYGSPVLEKMGCVRLNGYEEHYVVIPDREHIKNLTRNQYDALTLWLDEYGSWNNKKTFEVMTNDDDSIDWQSMEYSVLDTDYIISKIKRYYAFGELQENLKANDFRMGTAGYILPDGTFSYLDEYHGDDYDDAYDLGYPEFSNTHAEDDTCIRIYDIPNETQYKILERVIDKYLDYEGYCKIELYDKETRSYYFYTCYSLYEDACEDNWSEKVGNWTGYQLVNIIKNNVRGDKMKESLTEATRNQVLSKSKSGKGYADKTKGSRWTRKSHCRISNNVKDYNRIDMDTFWKKDVLSFKVSIVGESDTYDVTIEFNNILKNLQNEVQRAKNKFDRDSVFRALMTSINNGQIKYDCTCNDFKYRLAYQASKNGYKAGTQETRPSDETNPDDALGAACKHILLALNNAQWLRNIASVIVNYANYCKDNMEYNYSKYIFPKIFNMDYKKAVEACSDDFDENGNIKDNLKSDEATINLANAIGKIRGRIKPGSNKNPVAQKAKEEENK